MREVASLPGTPALARPLARLVEFVDRGGPYPIEYDELAELFDQIAMLRTEEDAEAIKSFAQSSRGAFNSLQTNQGFVCKRPHGYHGDFEIIDRIYTNWVSNDPTLERWDRFFQESSAAKAVRARKDYCRALLYDLVNSQSRAVSVLNVGSGPGRDIYEFLSQDVDLAPRVRFHFVEQDLNALEYASRLLKPFWTQVTLEHSNVFRWHSKQTFDLVWCSGLFDYLNDRLFIRLLQRLARSVRPGGELVIGNFSNRNTHRNYMEFGGWHLIHRDEADLLSLFQHANISKVTPRVGREPNGVNLFLHVRADSNS